MGAICWLCRHYNFLVISCFFFASDFRVMDSSESQHVLFHSVANCYVIKPNESIACQYAVLPSVTQSCQDYVGIFKVGSKHTRDCLVLSWPPEDHSNESDVKHSCVLFDG
jgi:hypothetical protein